MESTVLKAEIRHTSGTGSNNRLRAENYIPAILYASHISPISIKLKEKDVAIFLNSNNVGSSLDIDIEGDKRFVILKNIQNHPVNSKVLHMDFQELKAGEKIRINIPIFLTGKENLRDLICQDLLSELEISCLPKHLIDNITIDVSDGQDGDQVTVSDLEIFNSETIEVLSDPDSLVYIINEAQEFIEPEVEEDDELELESTDEESEDSQEEQEEQE